MNEPGSFLYLAPMVATLLLALAASVQEPEPPARPRVGVVLSAGEAHALAQVGALEALEELRVPVDFVVGSGVGALVGGLYAAGYSAGEIRAMTQDRTWLDAIDGRVPRRLLSWRQRSVSRDFLLDLPVAFGPGRLGLAPGLVRTRWLSWKLASATIHGAGAKSFDELPIPFRSVATDLLRAEIAVLDRGDLPSAILAGMATPGLYAPIEVDGRALASGSLLDPLPVDVALAAGCDALVVIDCSLELDRPARLESFLGAYAHPRLVAAESPRRAARARLRAGDVLIEPETSSADEADFAAAANVFDEGRAAVALHAAELARLALGARDYDQHLAERRARRVALPRLGAVSFEDESGLDESVLRDRIESRPGAPLDDEQVSLDLRRLYGLDYHERIDATLLPRADGTADLRYRMLGADDYLWNPRLGVALEGVFGQDATFVLGGAFTIRPYGGHGAEWRNRVEVGSRIVLLSEFWQPIDRSARWFVAPSIGYDQHRVNVTDEEEVLASLDVWEASARLDAGRVLGDWGEARVGLVSSTGRSKVGVGDPTQLETGTFEQGAFEGAVTVDTVDSLALPREGTIGRVVVTTPVEWLGGEEESFLQAQFDRALAWDRTSLVLGAEFDTALDDEEALESAFPLGGFLRLSGLGRDRVSGAHVALARAVTFVQLGRRGVDRDLVEWNVGASLEAGQAWGARDDIDLHDLRASGSLFVAADTLFGAVFLGAGWTEPGEAAVFLVFGNLFGNWPQF